jgi:predicted GNAT family acetyltransferase
VDTAILFRYKGGIGGTKMSQIRVQQRFFRHYKDKPYRYLGVVRHSETLEEMALYECLYENKLGTMWVRPKDMFFEKIELQGELKDRFAPVNIDYTNPGVLGAKELADIKTVCEKVFEQFNSEKVESVLRLHQKYHFQIAYDRGQAVGFKLGYAIDRDRFYSWHGGVLPSMRGLGIASEMMRRQHAWCKEQGLKNIETRTRNKFPEMISLNLRFGFQIVGCLTDTRGVPKIIMNKSLKD